MKIVNGRIKQFRFGVLIQDDADQNTVENVTVRNNKLDGLIAVNGSDALTLKNVRSIANGAEGSP